jgi:hypothetical protein
MRNEELTHFGFWEIGILGVMGATPLLISVAKTSSSKNESHVDCKLQPRPSQENILGQ